MAKNKTRILDEFEEKGGWSAFGKGDYHWLNQEMKPTKKATKPLRKRFKKQNDN
jgi:hypothetical protein